MRVRPRDDKLQASGPTEIGDLLRIYCIQQWRFWLSIVCMVGVAVFGAIPGIGIAVVLASSRYPWTSLLVIGDPWMATAA